MRFDTCERCDFEIVDLILIDVFASGWDDLNRTCKDVDEPRTGNNSSH